MSMNYGKALKCFGIVAVAGSIFQGNTLGEWRAIGLLTFFDKKLWQSNQTKAQKLYGDKWREEYFKDPRKAYQDNLQGDRKEELNNTHLYILISSYKQAKYYGGEVVESMEANAKHLRELGVTPHIIVRCDGDREKGGITEDVGLYAAELKERKISFKCHESAGVKMKDLTFDGNNSEHAHWELIANEKNLGCSGT